MTPSPAELALVACLKAIGVDNPEAMARGFIYMYAERNLMQHALGEEQSESVAEIDQYLESCIREGLELLGQEDAT